MGKSISWMGLRRWRSVYASLWVFEWYVSFNSWLFICCSGIYVDSERNNHQVALPSHFWRLNTWWWVVIAQLVKASYTAIMYHAIIILHLNPFAFCIYR